MNNYTEVPNIISCKDLDYLSDMFSWNYGAYKCTKNAYESATDMEIKEMLNNAIPNVKAEIKDYKIDDIADNEDLSIEADMNVKNFSLKAKVTTKMVLNKVRNVSINIYLMKKIHKNTLLSSGL